MKRYAVRGAVFEAEFHDSLSFGCAVSGSLHPRFLVRIELLAPYIRVAVEFGRLCNC